MTGFFSRTVLGKFWYNTCWLTIERLTRHTICSKVPHNFFIFTSFGGGEGQASYMKISQRLLSLSRSGLWVILNIEPNIFIDFENGLTGQVRSLCKKPGESMGSSLCFLLGFGSNFERYIFTSFSY